MEKEINVIDTRDRMSSSNELQLIDVRSQEDFNKVAIPGFQNIPLDELSSRIQELDGKKDTLLICRDGSKSNQALALLEACGFHVKVIRGGLSDWSKIINTSMKLD